STKISGAGSGMPFGSPIITRGAIQETTDPFEQVANYYARKMGINLPTVGGSGSQSSGSECVTYQSDNYGPRGPRPVKVQSFDRRAPGGSVVVFITRADGEEHTHVILYWLPRQ